MKKLIFTCALPLMTVSCKGSSGSSTSDLKEAISASGSNPRCGGLSSEILTNGVWENDNPAGFSNSLIAATLAHHAYPYAWKGADIQQTLKGLSPDQVSSFREQVKAHWRPLGADTIEFIEFDDAEKTLEANAMVLGTKKDVFVVFRGVSRITQFMRAFRNNDIEGVIAGKKIRLWETNYLAYKGIIDQVEKEVLKARSQTTNASTAKIWLIGHSSGGAYAALSALDLTYKHPELVVGGIYTFGSNMSGIACSVGDTCLSSMYNPKFGSMTYRWVNDNDLGPFLPKKEKDHQNWVHLPAPEQGIFRITGPTCERVYGKKTENICNESIKKPDGSAQSSECKPGLADHWSSLYVTKIKTCLQTELQKSKNDQRQVCAAEILNKTLATSPKNN